MYVYVQKGIRFGGILAMLSAGFDCVVSGVSGNTVDNTHTYYRHWQSILEISALFH